MLASTMLFIFVLTKLMAMLPIQELKCRVPAGGLNAPAGREITVYDEREEGLHDDNRGILVASLSGLALKIDTFARE